MEELEFTGFNHGSEGAKRLRTLLGQFEHKTNISVRLNVLPWSEGWSNMVSVVLYRDGPDISEIGSTWVGDFVRMDALHKFSAHDIAHIGGHERFLESSWASSMVARGKSGPKSCWTIPWSADTRPVLYRRDLLQQAGIDENNAFQDPTHFELTLKRLQESGVTAPLVLPTTHSRLTIHILASWVWGAGGDFVEKDLSSVSFNQPDALQGMSDYFKLGRYLPENHNILEEAQANNLFLQGDAAVTIGGHWLLQDQNIAPEVKENLGVAPVPGVPFVGGMNLAFWEHSYKDKAVIKLIEFLVNDESALDLFPEFGLPAWHDGIDNLTFSAHPSYAVLGQMLKTGRSFPNGHFWGLVENRLTDSFPFIWKDVLASPNAGVDQILHNHLDPLAQRLNITMQSKESV